MPKGKLIVIDGTDGSGKRTQTEFLFKNLKKQGIKTATLDIPVYESFTGELVARYLLNEFGPLNPYVSAVLFAINRFQFRDKIVGWLKEGRVVVLNRYVTANQIHQAANAGTKNERDQFKEWVGKLEYEILGLPVPDLIFFLNMPVEIAVARIKNKSAKERKYAHGTKTDMLESDIVHQREAQKELLRLAKKMKHAHVIECMKGKQLLSREEIASKIWKLVLKTLK